MVEPSKENETTAPLDGCDALVRAGRAELASITLSEDGRPRYRELLRDALSAIRSFDGTESRYENLFARLIVLEDCMKNMLPDGTVLTDGTEELISHNVGRIAQSPVSISRLLDRAQRKFAQSLSMTTEELLDALSERGVPVERLNLVLVPPDSEPTIVTGGGEGFDEIRRSPRLRELISGLQEIGIYVDDLIVRRGVVATNMVREEPYVLVEVPKMGKEILVCNQIGEATFVSQRILGAAEYARITKSEMAKNPDITRIVYREAGQWKGDIHALLLVGVTPSGASKLDVALIERIRTAIQQTYSADTWTHLYRSDTRFLGMGIHALAQQLGTGGTPGNNREDFLRLGERIFGGGTAISTELRKLTEEREFRERLGDDLSGWSHEIRTSVGSSDDWLQMNMAARTAYRLAGVSLRVVADMFGLEGDPTSNFEAHCRLGEQIFRGDRIITTERERLETIRLQQESLGNEIGKWAKEVKEIVPTPENWVGMTREEALALRVAGVGMSRLATVCGVEGNVFSDKAVFLRLGEKLFGSGTVITEQLEGVTAAREQQQELGTDEDAWRRAVVDSIGTAEAWLEIGTTRRTAKPVAGVGLPTLAKVFGLERNPVNDVDAFLELGEVVFGNGTVISDRRSKLKRQTELKASPEHMAEAVRKTCGNTESWIAMRTRDRKSFKLEGLGMAAVASVFGFDEQVIKDQEPFLELGVKIFGEDPALTEALTRVRADRALQAELGNDGVSWAAAVQRECSTAKAWLDMSLRERKQFHVAGMGIIGIASRMGTGGNPLASRDDYLALGRAIYGDVWPLSEKIEAAEAARLERDAVEEKRSGWIAKLRAACDSPEKWIGLTRREKREIKIGGKGLRAIATEIGIPGNPIFDNESYYRLGVLVFDGDSAIAERLEAVSVTHREQKRLGTDVEAWAAAVRDVCPTAAEWIGLNEKERLGIKVAGLGIKAFSRKMGIEGNPAFQRKTFLQLGLLVYGEAPEIKSALSALA